jgi:hypothetical protein
VIKITTYLQKLSIHLFICVLVKVKINEIHRCSKILHLRLYGLFFSSCTVVIKILEVNA